jgi:hypothetical protein
MRKIPTASKVAHIVKPFPSSLLSSNLDFVHTGLQDQSTFHVWGVSPDKTSDPQQEFSQLNEEEVKGDERQI